MYTKRTMVVVACTMCVAMAFAGEWDAARAEWNAFRENYEPDYSDGAKYLLPPERNRFDAPFVVVKDGTVEKFVGVSDIKKHLSI